MDEKEGLKFKLLKLIISNIAILVTMFMIFGLFLFFMIRTTVYSSVDQRLIEAKNQILEFDKFSRESESIFNIPEIIFFKENITEHRGQEIIKNIINPNITVIFRDENGNIVNNGFGGISEFASGINFDKKNMDKIYDETVLKTFNYRGLNIEVPSEHNSQYKYFQLLINVDTERLLVDGYFKIIMYAIVVLTGLSIIVSFYISRRTLEPLKESIDKQMEFVQNVSHELRTPLTIIQAKQELLLQEPNSKILDKSEDIVLTLNETKRLSKMVKDLLQLSRADNKKMNLQKESINIDDYIKEIVSPYMEVAELEEKSIILNLNYKADVKVDTNKIYQLMIILLDNAIKYTETNDKIEICTYQKDNKCVIEVKDTGIGVSEEGLKRIFERFYREDAARNRETGGSGLGLSIANMIVSAHNGTIKVSHNNPKGTVFTIRLPKN